MFVITGLRIQALHFVNAPDFSFSSGYLGLLSELGALIGIICCCVPSLRAPFVKLRRQIHPTEGFVHETSRWPHPTEPDGLSTASSSESYISQIGHTKHDEPSYESCMTLPPLQHTINNTRTLCPFIDTSSAIVFSIMTLSGWRLRRK